MDAPREVPQHTGPLPAGTPRLSVVETTVALVIRRAADADAAAVEDLIGRAPALGHEHVTFVLSEDGQVIGALDLAKAADHLSLDAIAVAEAHRRRGHGTRLLDFAETVARRMKLTEIRLGVEAVAAQLASPFFAETGFRDGRKQLSALGYLDGMGVPLLRDGDGPLTRVAHYRFVWAALAVIVGAGSISVSVFSGAELTLALIVVPAALCLAGAIFALWQLALVVVAARRHGWAGRSWTVVAGALLAALGILYAVSEKALPQLVELHDIWRGDEAFADYRIEISPNGSTLKFSGPFGTGASDKVGGALDRHKDVHTIVFDSPGGRFGEGYSLFDLIRRRRLDTHVQEKCSSACTIAFLGGQRRSISQEGVLGFHRGGFPGMNAAEMRDANRQLETFMTRRGGVGRDFAARVLTTPFDDVWYPTHDELKAGRVIHAVTAP
jgi:N-acetylglutamate synthase-like GNAT family acetyltransferase